MSPAKSARCVTLKWLRGTDDNGGVDIWLRPHSTADANVPSFLLDPPTMLFVVSRSLLLSPFSLSISLSLCHSATNGENMRCSSRVGRAVTVVQLGPAYCFFRAKGLTYEPRRMGAKRRCQPAICVPCLGDNSETCRVRASATFVMRVFSHSSVSTLLSILWF